MSSGGDGAGGSGVVREGVGGRGGVGRDAIATEGWLHDNGKRSEPNTSDTKEVHVVASGR